MAKPNYSNLHPADKALNNMNYRDLKIACIVRGMEFNELVESYHGILATFFKNHYTDHTDIGRLEDFDHWMDKQLEANGHEVDSPLRQFKLSSVLDPETQDLVIRRKRVKKAGVKVPKKVRAKVEKNKAFGVRKGTKKEYTMELVKKLNDLGKNLTSKTLQAKLISRVLEQYPDANEKSIKIWISKARKSLVNENS